MNDRDEVLCAVNPGMVSQINESQNIMSEQISIIKDIVGSISGKLQPKLEATKASGINAPCKQNGYHTLESIMHEAREQNGSLEGVIKELRNISNLLS